MGRPKTEAATYKNLMVRIPAGMLEDFKGQAAVERRSLNAQLLCMMDEWLRERKEKREHAYSASKAS